MHEPSEKILQYIGFDTRSPFKHYRAERTLYKSCEGLHVNTLLAAIKEEITSFYGFCLMDESIPDIYQKEPSVPGTLSFGQLRPRYRGFGLLLNESLRNILVHGPQHLPSYQLGLYLGVDGGCYSFQDWGDFFKDPEVKKLFETRQSIGEKYIDRSRPHGGFGVPKIYEESDIIEVDTKNGILFCAQGIERILVRES